MPIYAYRCQHCGHAKDVLQKVSDPVLTVCPACGEPTFRKQVTAAGFQLKGSGWYVTDFRGDKPAKRGDGGEAADSPPSEGKPSGAPTGDSTTTAKPEGASPAAGVKGTSTGESGREKPATAAAPTATKPSAATSPPSGTGAS